MPKVLMQGTNPVGIAFNNTALRYAAFGGYQAGIASTEAVTQIKVRGASQGTFMGVRIIAWANAAVTFRLRIAGASSIVHVLTVNATGWWETNGTQEAIADGAAIDFSGQADATGTATATTWQVVVDTPAKSPIVAGNSAGSNMNSALTRYTHVFGRQYLGITAQGDAELTLLSAHSVSDLEADVSAFSLNAGALTITLRKNRADETALQVAPVATGLIEDIVGSVAFVAGDEINLSCVTGGTAGAAGIRRVVLWTTGRQILGHTNYASSFPGTGGSWYFGLSGGGDETTGNATEANVQFEAPFAFTLANFQLYCPNVTAPAVVTVTVRKNGNPTALTLSRSSAGLSADADTVDFAIGDLVTIEVTLAGGAGSANVDWSVELFPSGGAGSGPLVNGGLAGEGIVNGGLVE